MRTFLFGVSQLVPSRASVTVKFSWGTTRTPYALSSLRFRPLPLVGPFHRLWVWSLRTSNLDPFLSSPVSYVTGLTGCLFLPDSRTLDPLSLPGDPLPLSLSLPLVDSVIHTVQTLSVRRNSPVDLRLSPFSSSLFSSLESTSLLSPLKPSGGSAHGRSRDLYPLCLCPHGPLSPLPQSSLLLG